MKLQIAALAAVCALSFAAPALAAQGGDRSSNRDNRWAPYEQVQGHSDHCRAVLGDNSQNGSKEWEFCKQVD